MTRAYEHANRPVLKTAPALTLFAALLLLFTVLPLAYLFELQYLQEPFLSARLWSQGPDRFGDFWHYRQLLEVLHQPEFFTTRDRFAYPAPCALIYQGLYRFGSHPHVSFNLLLWSVEGVSALLLLRAMLRRGLHPSKAVPFVILLVATSYPWHTLYDRGNIELFVYVLIASGVWAWFAGHERLAALLWGCAGALKIYPLLLLVLFAKRGSWRTCMLGLICFLSVLFLSFWYVGPTIKLAANGTMWGIRGFVGTYGAHTRFNELVLDHSLLGGMKELLTLPIFPLTDRQIALSHTYEAVVALAGPFAFARWRRTAPPVNQLCLLLLAMVLLPPVSYDYTLVHGYLVIGIVLCAYLEATRRGVPFPGARMYVVAFAILCTAENWINIFGFQPNGLLKAAALTAVAIHLIRNPLRLESYTEPRALPPRPWNAFSTAA